GRRHELHARAGRREGHSRASDGDPRAACRPLGLTRQVAADAKPCYERTMRFLFRLFRWRRRRPKLHAIGEAEAYARSYGDRSEEIVNVERVPAPPVPPVPEPRVPPPRLRPPGGRISDAALRSAFLARLAS